MFFRSATDPSIREVRSRERNYTVRLCLYLQKQPEVNSPTVLEGYDVVGAASCAGYHELNLEQGCNRQR